MFEVVVGQDNLKNELQAIAGGLKVDSHKAVCILLRGPGGCGKTFMAKEFCQVVGGKYSFQIPSPTFSMPDSIVDLRCHVVDEIHLLRKPEIIYPYIDSNRYVFVFCTTNTGVLPEPFTSRCLTYTFDNYSLNDLVDIIIRYSEGELDFMVTRQTAMLIAERARGSPRVCKKFVERLYFMITQGRYPKTLDGINNAFNVMGIYEGGFTVLDRKYLEFLGRVGHASLSTISATIDVDRTTIAEIIEPFLIDKELVTISSKGRQFIANQKGVLDND